MKNLVAAAAVVAASALGVVGVGAAQADTTYIGDSVKYTWCGTVTNAELSFYGRDGSLHIETGRDLSESCRSYWYITTGNENNYAATSVTGYGGSVSCTIFVNGALVSRDSGIGGENEAFASCY